MAQPDGSESAPEPPPGKRSFLNKLLRRPNGNPPSTPSSAPSVAPSAVDEPLLSEKQPFDVDACSRPSLDRHVPRQVIAGLPRAQTFRRQQSEQRTHLAPIETPPNERRVASVDRRRSHDLWAGAKSPIYVNPRTSAPGLLDNWQYDPPPHYLDSLPNSPADYGPTDPTISSMFSRADDITDGGLAPDSISMSDVRSTTASQYEGLIHDELEKTWILNLSMHFRDLSKREKFFVTYREREHLWRRVTISLDYRDAPPESLETDLIHTRYQREKSSKIYKAIRESLLDIQFYDTVTNLKLQTTNGRLHVHVVEDGNEIIHFPTVHQVRHLGCRRIRERDIVFDSHMSGFVYKVRVHGQTFIKKEIPSPDTIEEFLYEINALHSLRYSNNVIKFYGVVVDDYDDVVKGLLIGYAHQGALVDFIFDNCKDSNRGLSWTTREKWARQIVHGLADIHDSGFVQGDFTLSNIVIDQDGDAKIIDINRRGCPVGWEPPEATALIEANYRISMYIGVKSDLYQLGMVLWSLAMLEDEPEIQGRPLILGPEINVPDWYRQMTEICLSNDPRMRMQASSLLNMFPPTANGHAGAHVDEEQIEVDDGHSLQEYVVDGYHGGGYPIIKTVGQPRDWSYAGRTYVEPSPEPYEPYYHARGRSPPSPLPSHFGRCESPDGSYHKPAWAENRHIRSSYSDVDVDEMLREQVYPFPAATPTPPTALAAGDGKPEDDGVRDAAQGLFHGDEEHPCTMTDDGTVDTKQSLDEGPQSAQGAPLGASEYAQRPNLDSTHMGDVVSSTTIRPVDASATPTPETSQDVTDGGVSLGGYPVGLVELDHELCHTTSLGDEQHNKVDSFFDKSEPEPQVSLGGQEEDGVVQLADAKSYFPRKDIPETSGATPRPTVSDGAAKEAMQQMRTTVEPETTEHSGAKLEPKDEAAGEIYQGQKPQRGSPGPRYVESRALGVTAPEAGIDEGAALPRQNMDEQDMNEQAANIQKTNARMMYQTIIDSKENTTERESAHEYGRGCRQNKVPVSLTGIGAAHLALDGDVMREKGVIDDDFDMVTRPEMMPNLMITTDATT